MTAPEHQVVPSSCFARFLHNCWLKNGQNSFTELIKNALNNLLRIQVERLMTSVIAFVITVDWLCCEANCHTLLGGG